MDLRERRAWVYLRAIAAEEASLARARALEAQHARALSLQAPGLEQSARQQLSDATDRIEEALERELMPWAAPQAATRGDVRTLESRWAQCWGAPMDDPEMQRKIAEACRKIAPAARAAIPRR